MPRILTKLRIDEISACDRGAGEGVKVVLMKRQPKFKSFADALADQQSGGDDDRRDDDGDRKPNTDHAAARLADLLVESGKFPHRAAALDYLLNSAHGRALMAHHKREDTPMTMHDPEMTAKMVIEKRSANWTRAEFDQEISKRAKAIGKSFAWTAEHDEIGKLLMRAQRFAKIETMSLTPTMVGGEQVNPDDASEAYNKLTALAEKQRALAPFMTAEQAFARVFSDPENRELAQRAHRRPPATTIYPFPRG